MATAAADPADFLRLPSASELKARLDALEAERRALAVLLRAARARDRHTRAAKTESKEQGDDSTNKR